MDKPEIHNAVSRLRWVYAVGMPLVLALIAGAIVLVVIHTKDAKCAVPLLIAFYIVARMVRTCQFWLSTPDERAQLTPERESLADALTTWLSTTRQPTGPGRRRSTDLLDPPTGEK